MFYLEKRLPYIQELDLVIFRNIEKKTEEKYFELEKYFEVSKNIQKYIFMQKKKECKLHHPKHVI